MTEKRAPRDESCSTIDTIVEQFARNTPGEGSVVTQSNAPCVGCRYTAYFPLALLLLALPLSAADCSKQTFSDISPDYSKSRSIREDGGNIVIHVSACTPDRRVLWGDLGGTMLAVSGVEEKGCRILYVTEMEQSGWEWGDAEVCFVPPALGRVVLPAGGMHGLDTSPMIDHCSPLSIPDQNPQ